MSETDDKSDPSAPTPSRQRDANQSAAEQEKPDQQNSQPDRLEVARRFLQEKHVKAASHERKTEFLKSKGLNDTEIGSLLGQAEQSTSASSQQTTTPSSHDTAPKSPSTNHQPSPTHVSNDRPPIVTYPEFLVKPQRPPPLITKNGILSTLYAFVGLSTILYGASKYLLAPMVEDLTEARTELHHVAAKKLDDLVAQLEKTVSVIPSAVAHAAQQEDKDGSDDEDPTEMFHRDVGTQTLPIDYAPSPAAKPTEPASQRHANNLASLTKTLSVLRDQFRAQSEEFENIKTSLDVFRDDLDGMTYGGGTEFVGGYDIYGTSKQNEPEDEIRKVRDNIRRVKGLLLSTRNFPASTR